MIFYPDIISLPEKHPGLKVEVDVWDSCSGGKSLYMDLEFHLDDEVRKAFVEKCKAYGLEEADYKNFYVDAYDYKPRDPNDDSCAHDLGFSFTRLPADVVEQNVDEHCLRQYYNVNRG